MGSVGGSHNLELSLAIRILAAHSSALGVIVGKRLKKTSGRLFLLQACMGPVFPQVLARGRTLVDTLRPCAYAAESTP